MAKAKRDEATIVADFWKRVNKTETCWLWTGSKHQLGYGLFYLDGGVRVRAHRVSLSLAGVEIPDGLVVDHLCRTPACVRPDHLEVVTNAENIRRGISLPAMNARKTACPSGHPYAEGRICRECRREAARSRYQANPEKHREWSRRNRANARAAATGASS